MVHFEAKSCGFNESIQIFKITKIFIKKNKNKIFYTYTNMKQTIRLTESELRQMIEESINEAMQDEGFLSSIGRGLKNAFGGDAQRIGQGAQRAAQAVGRGAQRVGQAVGNAVGQGVDAVKQGAQNVQQGAQSRWNAAKAGYQANQNNDKIDRIIKDLTDLQTSGVLHGNAMNQAIKVLMTNLKQAKGRNNSTASAFRNAI